MQLIIRIWYKLLTLWWQVTVPIRLRAYGVELGKNVRFYGMPIVSLAKNSRLCIGDGVVLCSDSRFTGLGVNHPVVLRTLRPGAEINIGNNCGISGASICAAIKIDLGKDCLLGANLTITDTDFHAIKPEGRRFNNNLKDINVAPIKINSNVFIGAHSVILKGVVVGENSIIGAGSLVAKKIPVNEIWAGNPAKFIKALND